MFTKPHISGNKRFTRSGNFFKKFIRNKVRLHSLPLINWEDSTGKTEPTQPTDKADKFVAQLCYDNQDQVWCFVELWQSVRVHWCTKNSHSCHSVAANGKFLLWTHACIIENCEDVSLRGKCDCWSHAEHVQCAKIIAPISHHQTIAQTLKSLWGTDDWCGSSENFCLSFFSVQNSHKCGKRSPMHHQTRISCKNGSALQLFVHWNCLRFHQKPNSPKTKLPQHLSQVKVKWFNWNLVWILHVKRFKIAHRTWFGWPFETLVNTHIGPGSETFWLWLWQ